jgi:SPP1 gp7 family putative phage head morphogenesis protein
MPAKSPLALSFNLPFSEAIDALRARRVMLPDDYYMMPAVVRRDAFMISGLGSLDQVEAVKEKLATILEKGQSLQDFKAFAPTLDWDVTPAHLETIYRTAIQTAYNAGAWKSFERGKLSRPYLMYSAVNDSRTRPAHRALSGIIRPVDDPFWDSHSPPLGFNCRCGLIALSAKDAEARSLGGQGLNKPVTEAMQSDAGFGHKPGEHDATLARLASTRRQLAPAPVAQAFDQLNRALPLLTDMAANAPEAAVGAAGFAPVAGQTTWRDAGRQDLRQVTDDLRPAAPALLDMASDRNSALRLMAEALSISAENPLRSIQTPVESALIRYDLLEHFVAKELDARERYANFIIPTLESPFEVWAVEYSDRRVRNRYIGLFRGSRDFLVSVRVNLDGSVVWNIMQSDSKSLNKTRIGSLLYGR